MDESDIEVNINRVVAHPYDPEKREESESRQIAHLKELKRTRESRMVSRLLNELKTAARKEETNLYPLFIDCAKAYITEGEICGVLREVFGEYEPPTIF